MADISLLDETAQSLRQAYILRWQLHCRVLRDGPAAAKVEKLHPKWDGDQDSRGAQHQSVWPRLGQIAEKQRYDVRAWVATLFDLSFLFDHIPWPTDLTHREVQNRMARWADEARLDVVCGIRTEFLTLNREIFLRGKVAANPADTRRMTLLDSSLEVSPLVRYAAALRSGDEELTRQFEPAAVAQYLSNPENYQQALGSLFPTRLMQTAAMLREESRNGPEAN